MLTGRRLGALLAGLGLAAGLVLAVLPESYTAGPEAAYQQVDCGIAFVPKNPPAPPGIDDQCDAARVRRGMFIVIVVLFGAVVGGVVYFALGSERKRAL